MAGWSDDLGGLPPINVGAPPMPSLDMPSIGLPGPNVSFGMPPPMSFRADTGHPGMDAPSVQLTTAQIDFLTNTGSLIMGEDLRVGQGGIRGAPNLAQTGMLRPHAPAQQPGEAEEVRDLGVLQVVQFLGAGASAKVQLARHLHTGKHYALKDIQVGIDKRALRELGTEIRISRHVVSNHVVQCHNAFYDEGHMILVLEYMDGGSVADLLQKVGVVDEAYLADIARQALQGFVDLHTHQPRPIIHRDIKPSNLLLNRSGQLKISDFGVSRMLENSNDVGKTFAGTYTYMSPERILGDSYSFNSDIWAFGLSLLECAIGRYPYQPAMDYFTLLRAISQREPPSAPADKFSPEFCSFVECCLQKDPSRRWSARALLDHPFCRMYPHTRLVDLLIMTSQ